MRLLFERGFLCREHITTPDSSVLGRMKQGFSFLIDWYDGLLAHGVDPQDVNQTKFLAGEFIHAIHSTSSNSTLLFNTVMVEYFLIKAHPTCFTIPPLSLSRHGTWCGSCILASLDSVQTLPQHMDQITMWYLYELRGALPLWEIQIWRWW